MLSFLRPTLYPTYETRYYPTEGVPFVEQNATHWFVKTYLPDVHQEDFNAIIEDGKLMMRWKDHKRIKHQGRIYESSQDYEKYLDVPDTVTQDDISVKWNDYFAIITVSKPQTKALVPDTKKELTDGSELMKFTVPDGCETSYNVSIEKNRLIVNLETTSSEESEGGCSKYRSIVQKSMTIPEGVDPSNIDAKIENGALLVSFKKSDALPSSAAPEQIEEKKKEPEDNEVTIEDVSPDMED